MVIFGILIIVLLAALNALPLTFFGMLFLGNVGWNISFLGLLPGAIAVNIVKNNLITYTKGN